MIKSHSTIKKGFTLLEALVAISILMVAVAAPITIAQKGISSAVYTKEQMIASYLAQDAIEYIKNIRDEATMNDTVTNDWYSLLGDSDSMPGDTNIRLGVCLVATSSPQLGQELGCEIDTVSRSFAGPSNIQGVSAGSGPTFMKKDKTNKFYGYDTSGNYDVTEFKRVIKILKTDVPVLGAKDYEALVNVTVSWGTAEDKISVNTLIYNY
jgi:Tfp pilus assembly protein PilV